MKTSLRTLALALLAVNGASAAQNSELRVAGVIKPTACTPQLTGGSTLDLGTLKSDEVDDPLVEHLERDLSIVITCDAPTRVGIKSQDNRADSVALNLVRPKWRQDGAGSGARSVRDDLFGLGTSGRKKMGGYEVSFVPGSFVADGQHVDTISAPLHAPADGGRWVKREMGQMRSGVINAWAPAGTLQPGAYTRIRGMLRVRAMLAPSSELQVLDQMNLDGSITLEVQYL